MRHKFILTKPLTLHHQIILKNMTNHPLFIIGTNRQLNIVRIALITDSEETLDFAGSVKNAKAI